MNRVIFRKTFLASAVFLGVAFPAFAEKVAAKRMSEPYTANGQTCKMVETVSISLSFSNIPVSLDAVKSNVDERLAEIDALAKDVGIKELIIQNMNYNIYSNNGGGYLLNGSFSLQIDNADLAAALMKALSGKAYVPNLSVNSYRQCQ